MTGQTGWIRERCDGADRGWIRERCDGADRGWIRECCDGADRVRTENVVTGRTRNAVRTLRALVNMQSFSVQASFVWNNLPAHIRHCIFSHSSKRLLKRFP